MRIMLRCFLIQLSGHENDTDETMSWDDGEYIVTGSK